MARTCLSKFISDQLDDRDPASKLYFAQFSPKIVGLLSTVTREEVTAALGDQAKRDNIYKARLAFRTLYGDPSAGSFKVGLA